MTPLVRNPGGVAYLARAMQDGALTALGLVETCLARIQEVDQEVRAWIAVMGEEALAAARELDRERKAGKVRGLLHGIPFAVKDVIDVAGLPTRANSPSRAGQAPATADATVVTHLRAAGAIVRLVPSCSARCTRPSSHTSSRYRPPAIHTTPPGPPAGPRRDRPLPLARAWSRWRWAPKRPAA